MPIPLFLYPFQNYATDAHGITEAYVHGRRPLAARLLLHHVRPRVAGFTACRACFRTCSATPPGSIPTGCRYRAGWPRAPLGTACTARTATGTSAATTLDPQDAGEGPPPRCHRLSTTCYFLSAAPMILSSSCAAAPPRKHGLASLLRRQQRPQRRRR